LGDCGNEGRRMTTLHESAEKCGVSIPEFHAPTMGDAIAAGDGVLMTEQALLLRECRRALDELLRDKPMLAAKLCGTTTLGNIRAMLYEYRPQGVFGGKPAEPVAWMCADESLIRSGYSRFSSTCSGAWNIPVYTTPKPCHQSLTEEEIVEIAKVTKSAEPGRDGYILPVTFARAIEDAFKAKNGITKETP
jgi:hypothetical protein